MSALSPRIGEVVSLWGTVRQVEAITPIGHYRVTLDIAPPKPAEPTGLGAVVEDADGVQWLRHRAPLTYSRPWVQVGALDVLRRYDDITAVRVLSEGVTA